MQSTKSKEPADMQAEVSMLRESIRRVYRYSQEEEDVEALTKALGALGLATTRLNQLLQAQGSANGWKDEKARQAAQALAQALDELAKEWGMAA